MVHRGTVYKATITDDLTRFYHENKFARQSLWITYLSGHFYSI